MKKRHIPLRTCVVCRQSSDKRTLLRVIRTPGEAPRIEFDRTGKANGRGAYVCAEAECIAKALKQKRFERSLSVSSVPEGLAAELMTAVPVPNGPDNQMTDRDGQLK
ncbi:MAG: RNase P modulator RnpM [Capsulimonadaceae bacterium]